MKIALDAMGGDFAPAAVVKGAIEALSCTPKNVELILLGNEDLIQKEFSSLLPSSLLFAFEPFSHPNTLRVRRKSRLATKRIK